MLADPFVMPLIVPSGAAVTNNWSRISVQGNATSYVKSTYTPNSGAVKYLRISHNTVGKGATARYRHLARIESPVVLDSVESGQMASLYIVADIPIVGAINALRDDLYKNFAGLLLMDSLETAYAADQPAFFNKWWQGEA